MQRFNGYDRSNVDFIAGWKDVSYSNGSTCVVIWLRGGGTTYFFHSNYPVDPVVYDGVQNSLPFVESSGSNYTYKTAVDSYVNSYGATIATNTYFNGSSNYFAGSVGVGTLSPDARLAVRGTVHASEVKVDLNVPVPDYVFEPGYKLMSLDEIKSFVKQNHHLPDIPSAKQIAKEGLNLGDMNTRLLKKIEELTRYLIEQENARVQQETELKNTISSLKNRLDVLEKGSEVKR
ncbi:hypothetical protein GS399_05265 [Pedobacter sp. HMF7647]|uniref:Uncharacterized protein n=1 Tax=Hufsiella arboris TaxID=2695275 RepID=A0A7K1Y729_9SPHI|nr:hypothetical protein [Hufsiella arboris]MXV50374.1 hypothetical protein [Hufsiella arboris]